MTVAEMVSTPIERSDTATGRAPVAFEVGIERMGWHKVMMWQLTWWTERPGYERRAGRG